MDGSTSITPCCAPRCSPRFPNRWPSRFVGWHEPRTTSLPANTAPVLPVTDQNGYSCSARATAGSFVWASMASHGQSLGRRVPRRVPTRSPALRDVRRLLVCDQRRGTPTAQDWRNGLHDASAMLPRLPARWRGLEVGRSAARHVFVSHDRGVLFNPRRRAPWRDASVRLPRNASAVTPGGLSLADAKFRRCRRMGEVSGRRTSIRSLPVAG